LLVRRERAYIQWCLHTKKYTTCPTTFIETALAMEGMLHPQAR
jgi:hypothetical protein